MNAKAREIWDKISAWGKARIGDISLMESLELALDPKKKQAILDEERAYAESIIADALAEQDKEMARMVSAIRVCVKALYQAVEIAPLDRLPPLAGNAIQEAQALLDSLLPPAEKEEPHADA